MDFIHKPLQDDDQGHISFLKSYLITEITVRARAMPRQARQEKQ